MVQHIAGSAFLLPLMLAVAVVDLRSLRIPDLLNLLILTGGVGYWLALDPANLPYQLACGGGFATLFWLVRDGHRRLTGRIGLGLGDVKLAGAGAVWILPELLPAVMLVASLGGLAFALLRVSADDNIRNALIPFGPFLATGFVLAWTWQFGFLQSGSIQP